MCGIAGILSSDPTRICTQRLKQMTDALAHRGPDGEAVWINDSGRVGMGHRRLAIIDLSPAGAQPFFYQDRYTIVYNGEIFNYIELREQLRSKGYSFSTRTDTEVILAAYDYYGPSCLGQLDGMFAFAIWDEQEKTLFLARDRFGEKPLFFYRDGKEFVFASELKALWAAGIKKESNKKMLFNFITIGYTQNPTNSFETFYQGVNKLPARTYLLYNATTGQQKTSSWWDIEPKVKPVLNEAEAIEELGSLLNLSVHRRLRSDVPVGTSLSGGLDSSSLVACMLKQIKDPKTLPTFSAVFPGFDKDESAYIQSVCRHFSVGNQTVTPDVSGLIKDFEKLVYHQDEPFTSASIYAQFKVFGLAASQPIKVLLDGQGADELLAGYHKYYNWYWQELYRSDKKAFALELEAAASSGISNSWTWKNRLAAHLPVYAGLFLKKQRTSQQRRSNDLSRDFIRLYGVSYYDVPRFDRLNGILYYNTLINGMEELLRYADRNSMAHGVEVRLPFLFPELVDFVFSLPAHFKIREGWTKWILRMNMDGSLPNDIAWRKDKTGYEPPQQIWMQDPILQEYIQEARRKLVDAGILKAAILSKKIQPMAAHAAENHEWRYLIAAAYLA